MRSSTTPKLPKRGSKNPVWGWLVAIIVAIGAYGAFTDGGDTDSRPAKDEGGTVFRTPNETQSKPQSEGGAKPRSEAKPEDEQPADKEPADKEPAESEKRAKENPQPKGEQQVGSSALGETSKATLTYVIDGDTIETSEGRVRIVGIDTPERNECGYQEAKEAVEKLLPRGSALVLIHPKGTDDADRYDRLLRYVETSKGKDVGTVLINDGLAIARYDSRDGYAHHPNEEKYRAASLGWLSDGRVITPACEGQPGPASVDSFEDGWWTQYRSCTHLKKNTVGHPKGPFDVNNPAEKPIYDWFAYGTGFNGDGDGDGLACE